MSDDFARRVTGVAALAEEVRRDLYLYVVAEPEPVSRDQAAAGVGVPRHTAKFHLDRLVEEGLLETEFRRLSGRQGPGAGRPAKLYRRSPGEVTVSLPERHYDLAGRLLAGAIEDSSRDGTPVAAALQSGGAVVRLRLGRRGPRPGGRPGHGGGGAVSGLRRARRARATSRGSSTGRSPCRTARSTGWPRSTRTWCAA